MGRTGCGKTSVLEAIAGLRPLLSGQIILDHLDVTNLRPACRGIGFVPQDGSLFNSMSVKENLSFSLIIRKWNRVDLDQRVEELSKLLSIKHLLNRSTKGLSGGERQRIALGRALAFYPKILLLDEPLSAVDEETRESLCELLKGIQTETGVTVLHVTHSEWEANRLSDVRIEVF
jgi:ABC-type sugar transport system ATPase subunit